MEKESVVRLRITREEKVLLHKGRVFRIVLPDVPVRLFFLLGQGPVSRMEFFVFRKMECWKQINHLLCEWLEML